MPMKFVPKVRLKSTKQSGCFGEFKSLDAESVCDRVSRWVTSIMQVDVSLSYAVTNLDKVLWINRFRLTQSSKASNINTVRSAVSFMDESSLSCRVSRFRVVSLARVPKRDSRFFEPVPEVLPLKEPRNMATKKAAPAKTVKKAAKPAKSAKAKPAAKAKTAAKK